jgi:hypothetical protein
MYIAPNPRLNASLADGQRLLGIIAANQPIISSNPRLYANDSGGAQMHPANDSQDNSDLPAWVNVGSPVTSDGTDPNLPIYLQVWISERQNFYNVRQVLDLIGAGVTLSQALN